MKNIQKYLLGFFLLIFILPELFLSPVLNTINGFLQDSNNSVILRPNFLTNTDNKSMLLITLLIQIIGIIGSLIFINKLNFSKTIKILLTVLLVIILIITSSIFYIIFSTRNGIGF